MPAALPPPLSFLMHPPPSPLTRIVLLPRRCQLLRGGCSVLQAASQVWVEAGVCSRRLQPALIHVNAGDVGAHARQGLCQQPAAAADVQQAQPDQWGGRRGVPPKVPRQRGAQESAAHRVHGVQRRKGACRVPPLPCQRCELVRFLPVHSGGAAAGRLLLACIAAVGGSR